MGINHVIFLVLVIFAISIVAYVWIYPPYERRAAKRKKREVSLDVEQTDKILSAQYDHKVGHVKALFNRLDDLTGPFTKGDVVDQNQRKIPPSAIAIAKLRSTKNEK